MIPDSIVGSRGVSTGFGSGHHLDLTVAVSLRSPLRSLQVKVSDFTEPVMRPAGAYSMASVPLRFGLGSPAR